VLTKTEENRFLVFERKVKNRIRNNFELDREFNSPNVMKSNRLRYAGHLPNIALFGAVSEGRRIQRRNQGGRMA
jgi:hypothetical protein